jgi:Flp pilus assembly pilin Flp
MRPLIHLSADFLRNQNGRTAVECALMLALTVLVSIGAICALGCGSLAKR